MKTCNLVACYVLAFCFIACEKSSEVITDDITVGPAADYTIFLENNNQLNAIVVGSTDEGMVLKNAVTSFADTPSSSLKYRTFNDISFFYNSNCQAYLQWFNAIDGSNKSIELFTDVDPCSIHVSAISHPDESIFLAYERDLVGKDKQYMIRIASLTGKVDSFTEIELDKKPVDVITILNRLFVLTLDEYVTDTYYLSVIDLSTNDNLIELDLGSDATKLFADNYGHIIISYPELHITLDPITLDKSYTTYGANTEPGFLDTEDSFLDASGKLYFQKRMSSAAIETVPAIYDFENNSTVVYLYENFLSESELHVKYSIAKTTSIGYDDKRKFVLIGYKKKGQLDKGGILRISPAPDFKIIDNIDLEGVPNTIFVQ